MTAKTKPPTAAEIFGADKGSLSDGVPREFQAVGDDCYRLALLSLGLEFLIDRLRREHHELQGELTVRCTLAGARTFDGTLSVADLNLSSVRARRERAAYLTERSKAPEIDWLGLLEELCQRVLNAERVGAPALHLRDVAPSPLDDTINVESFPVLRQHPMCLFGDGGSLKSYLALYLAGGLTQQGLKVLYADWEFTPEAHRDRLVALFPDPPDVLYAKCERPLVNEADRLRRIVREERIDYLIGDSVAFACDGAPESAEVAAAYFRGLRVIGVGSLSVAHMTKAETGDLKPLGSAGWHNGFRSTWYVQRGAEGADPDQPTIALFHRKSNVGRLAAPLGYTFTFTADRTTLRTTNLATVPDLAEKLPLWQRVREIVKYGPLTLARLAKDLEANVETLDRTVRRRRDVFARVDGIDGVSRIALVERRTL